MNKLVSIFIKLLLVVGFIDVSFSSSNTCDYGDLAFLDNSKDDILLAMPVTVCVEDIDGESLPIYRRG